MSSHLIITGICRQQAAWPNATFDTTGNKFKSSFRIRQNQEIRVMQSKGSKVWI